MNRIATAASITNTLGILIAGPESRGNAVTANTIVTI